MSESTVLVIGGGRFVGRHIVARLLADGYRTTILTRGRTPHPFEGLVEWLKCDRDDHERFDELLHRRGFDYVIDVISMNAEHAKHTCEFFFGRTTRFIHISTGAVYLLGPRRYNPYREVDAPETVESQMGEKSTLHAYGLAKREGELEIEKAETEKGFPGVILRMPIISGRYDYRERDRSYIQRVIDGGPIVAPVERRGSFRHVWVGDVVDAVMLSLDNRDAAGKVFNIASESILSLEDYLGIIARALNTSVSISYHPHATLNVELGAGYSLFSYPRAFIQDIYRARSVLGFNPSNAGDWLTELTRYYADEYKGETPAEYTKRREAEIKIAEKKRGT